MDKYLSQFDEFRLDVLKEIGNIGAGNAATALSKMISETVDMKVPEVKIVAFNELADLVGGPENIVVAVFFQIGGDVPGSMFFLIDELSARLLLTKMLGVKVSKNFTEIEVSTCKEVGNILASSYLAALADFTNLSIHPSVPGFSVDMAGAILNYGLYELGMASDFAIAINTTFLEGNREIKGQFFLLPDPNSLERVFLALGVSIK